MSKKQYDEKNSTFEVLIKADKSVWKKEQEKAENYFKANQTLPGFRKGKVPANLLKPVPQSEIMNRALNKIFNSLQDKAFEEVTKKEQVLSQPTIDISKVDANELEIKFVYPVVPHRFDLDLSKLKYKLEKVTLTDKDTKNYILDSLDKFAVWVPSTKKIDIRSKVNVSFKGKIDGKKFEGGDVEDLEFELNKNHFLPNFEEQLIGLKTKEEKEITITMPKDYYREKLAGKKAIFNVKINNVQEKKYPELDDKFVKSLNSPYYKTYDEMFNEYKKGIINREIVRVKDKVVNDAINYLADHNEIPAPSLFVNQELEVVNATFDQKLKESDFTREEYISSTDYTEEKLTKELEKEATKNVQRKIVNAWLIEQFKLKVEEKDLDKYYSDVAKSLKMEDKIEEIKQSQPRDRIANELLTDKFFNHFLNLLDPTGFEKLEKGLLVIYK